MLAPNAVLPCGTTSARRRHAAHGQTCAACDTTISAEPAAARDLQVLAENQALRKQIKAVARRTRLLADNKRLTARLNDADHALTALLQQPVIRHEAVDRIHRRLFPARKGSAA
jgi:hypothetical protein